MEELRFSAQVVAAMRAELARVSDAVVQAVVAEVPSYSRAFSGPMGDTIRQAVGMALAGFLDRVDLAHDPERDISEVVRQGAYDLGRGEARSGRTMDALLSAYRVGARVAWHELARPAVTSGMSSERVMVFAEMVFAYIDDLSAVSVAGHSDELETTGRVRQRLLERLAGLLVDGAEPDVLLSAARRAEWDPPETLTAVLVPSARMRAVITALGAVGARSLVVAGDRPVFGESGNTAGLLIPDAKRGVLMRVLRQDRAVIGPTVEWLQAAASFRRALLARALVGAEATIDTDEHLLELVRRADTRALDDLRARALAPLDDLKPAARAKLEETLRAWLLCQGRRDAVAEMLFVHPQTVRYRMGQIRELFGDRLTDPATVAELVVALGPPEDQRADQKV
ncbi:MAG TPA: helix-turn-helix domain-containing protein [Marmoricola sp.]